MKKEEEKVGFDLSTLSLEELIQVYQDINDFIGFLEENNKKKYFNNSSN